MLNILCRHSFGDFVKIPQKFLPLPMLETTTKSTIFEYKNVKFKAIIYFSGQTNVNNFMQTQLLWFCKKSQKFLLLPMLETTTKSTYFLPTKKKIQILWIEIQTNKNFRGF